MIWDLICCCFMSLQIASLARSVFFIAFDHKFGEESKIWKNCRRCSCMVPNFRKDENQQSTVKQLTENCQKNNWVTKKTRFFRKLFKPKMICSTIRWNFVVNFWRLDNKNVVPYFNLKRSPLFHLTLNWQRKISFLTFPACF